MPEQARIGDRNVMHCSAHTMDTGSANVIVNGRGAVRVGDLTITHLRPSGSGCSPHIAAVVSGSQKVIINGMGAARLGDPLGGCTAIAEGSPNVITGD